MPLRMLMIDADRRHRMLAALVCWHEPLPLVLTSVEDTHAAVAHLRCTKRAEELPDVITVDLENGPVRGFNAIAAVRSTGTGAGIPLIAFTGMPAEGYARSCLIAGASRCVAKPARFVAYREFLRSLTGNESPLHLRGGHPPSEIADIPMVVRPGAVPMLPRLPTRNMPHGADA
jgi:CheY-like chemotaxis protein